MKLKNEVTVQKAIKLLEQSKVGVLWNILSVAQPNEQFFEFIWITVIVCTTVTPR